MDMSKSYRAAAKKHLPGVGIVFDRFHVMQLATRSIDKVRRKHQATLDEEGKKTLKGSRFLFLSNYENLEEDKKLRLTELLEINEALLIMHTMKEQLRLFWTKRTREDGQKFLATWICDAIAAANDYQTKAGVDTLKPLRTLAFTLTGHMSGLLNYFDCPITNGKAEGINNKIKTLKRQAYGYRDMDYFKLRLYHLHTSRYRLCG